MQTKQRMLKAIEDLPEDANVEDALERLYLLYKIDKGIEQADAGKRISQTEARRFEWHWKCD
jgi:hypothetical protein